MAEILYQFAPLLILMIVLIWLSGWFSGTETALTNLTPVTLAGMRKNKVRNIKYILKLKRDMNRTLIAILIGNNIVNVLLAAIAALVADYLFNTIGVSIAVGVITFLIIVFGEITPKSYAIRASEKIACRNSRWIYYLRVLLSPLIVVFIFITEMLLKIVGITAGAKRFIVTDESIMGLASLGQMEGAIKIIEKEIIQKVFRFGDLRCRKIMVPISNVYYLEQESTFNYAKRHIAEKGFTRVPIMNKKNKVIGILYSKDLLNKGRGSVVDLMRKPIFFSINSHITHVFDVMRKKHVHMAVIRDKYFNHVGIITLEDILEELVGEIYDEYFKVKYRK